MTKGYTVTQKGKNANGELTNGGVNREWYIVPVDEMGRHGRPMQNLPSFEKRVEAINFIKENGQPLIGY